MADEPKQPLPSAHPDGADVTYHTAEWHAARLAALTVGD